MEDMLSKIKEMGLDTTAGLEYTGGYEKYISALQRFYNNYEKNCEKVRQLFSEGDYQNYMITVHALKSNSRMIGADALGEMFEELEMAAGRGNTALIEEKNGPALEAYKALVEKMTPIGEMARVVAADELSAQEARAAADKLLEALDDFDDRLSKELAEKLLGYPFRITQRDRLREVLDYIRDFMYDDAADIIREIYPTIE
jgi:HPt (histidine-containing phosphotransfer) domain-containing protein